jgi:hypothetical protein
VARKRIQGTGIPGPIAESARTLLAKVPETLPSSPQELRDRVLHFVSLSRPIKELAVIHVRAVLNYDSASERILQYLRMFLGTPIEGEELEIVSGISEYARRIREWRVEFGWPIKHNGSTYILEKDEPDGAKATLWRTLNEIRRTDAGGRERMRLLFLALPVGTVVTTAQLRYVTEGKDMRRVRELRTQLGFRIMTKKTGMPKLKNDEYVLVDKEPVAEHDRDIENKTMIEVLIRDGQRCRKCGWHPNDRITGDPRQYIEFHHATWHVQGGANDADNLITLCNVHHREVHNLKLNAGDLNAWLSPQS